MDWPRRSGIIIYRLSFRYPIGKTVMALSITSDHSHSARNPLLRTVREHSDNDLTLEQPDPATESGGNVDGANNVVGNSIQIMDVKIGEKFDDLDKRMDTLEIQVEDVKTQVTALQVNSLRRMLDDPIEPISAPIELESGRRYMVARDFPETIKDFWKLIHDSSTLSRLVRHYSVAGWQKWNRCSSDDAEASLYDDLDAAVAAHPHKCLRILASKWGLQYSYLERPNSSSLGKRVANTHIDLDPKRSLGEEGVQEENGSVVSQDRDGNTFMHRRGIWPGPRVPPNPYRTVGRIQATISSRSDVGKERRDWLEGLGLPIWRNDDVFSGLAGLGYAGLDLDWEN